MTVVDVEHLTAGTVLLLETINAVSAAHRVESPSAVKRRA
jgi:hypothetical protein